MADDEPKPRSIKTKRRRASMRDEHVRYVVAIETWDWSYSFGLAGRKDSLDPYMEHRHFKITGKLLRPVDPKVNAVELWFLPADHLDEEKRKDLQPTAVGSLRLHGGRLNGLLSIPKDSLDAHPADADRRSVQAGRHRRSQAALPGSVGEILQRGDAHRR
jgi:hypothetical protein